MSSISTTAAPPHTKHIPGESGIWVFIGGDMMVFSLFFGVFTYYRAQDVALFAASQTKFNIAWGAINTLLLLTSSLFVVLGVHAVRERMPLARSTLAEWVGRVGVALQPLVDRLTARLRERHVLHADETPVPQLDPGKGKTKKAYLWAYRSNDLEPGPPILVFDYQPGRHGLHARNFLDGWHGHLMVDDYAGYKALFAQGVTELACLAHARRKIFDLYAANQSPIAAEALRRIGELYDVERQA